MRLFKQTPEDYYNAPYAEFPALIRGTVFVVMASFGPSPSSCGAGR